MSDVEVRDSLIHGRGVFATRDFAERETVLLIDDSRVVDENHPLEDGEFDYHCDYLANGKVVLMQSPERHINSSCDPNTFVKTIRDVRHVIARRTIQASEEITYDYIINCHGGVIWQCQCGIPRCRQTIVTSFFDLPHELQKEYLPLLDDWFLNEHREKISTISNVIMRNLILILLFVLAMSALQTVRAQTAAETPALKPNVLNLPPAQQTALETALQKRDFKEAETILVNEINKNPNSPDTAKILVFAAGVFFLDGDFLNAAIAYKKAEKLAPLDERSRFTLAMSYIRLQRQAWAAPELERLTKEQPNNALYWYWLGRIDYDAQKYDQAVIKFNKAVALDAMMMRAYDNLGLCYDHLSNTEAAIKSFRRAVELNRTQAKPSAWPLVNLAGILIGKNELEEAQTLLIEAIRFDPKLPQAYYNLGQISEKHGKTIEAIEALNQAIALDATYAEPHYTLSRIYQKLGNKEKAQQALAKFQELKKSK